MQKFIALITFISVLKAQVAIPFELELRTRLVNNEKTMINIQLTNLMDKPIDYVEGFVIESDFNKNLIDEKRLVLIYGYEPPLHKGFSTSRSISFEKPTEGCLFTRKSPKSVAFPVEEIVTKSISSL